MSHKLYLKKDFAEKVGVHPSRISKLLKDGKLKVSKKMGIELITDCPTNLALFSNPNFLRGKKRPKKVEKAI